MSYNPLWVFVMAFAAGSVTKMIAEGLGLTGWPVTALGFAAAAAVGAVYLWQTWKRTQDPSPPRA